MRQKVGRGAVLMLAGLSVTLTPGIAQQAASTGDERGVSLERDQKQSLDSIRKAVIRALPLLVKASSQEYPKHRECFSCHNQGVPAVAWPCPRLRIRRPGRDSPGNRPANGVGLSR